MKQHLKEKLEQIADRIQRGLDILDNEDHCLLGEFEHIKESFIQIESIASTFYLNCYLSAYTDKYSDLSISIQNLAQRRHGALIVVERSDPVDPFIQPGIALGAQVTAPLLESIFYPGNPLHDGAVLIRSNQIISVRNILPLASRAQVSKGMGTRHRAAIGLTEQTDAIVMVVSEETGRASFANRGNIYPVISP